MRDKKEKMNELKLIQRNNPKSQGIKLADRGSGY
jgi:hypothetical protein